MQRIYTTRRLIFLAFILVISNLVITGVSLSVIYKKSIEIRKAALIGIVDRQKSLIYSLYKEGKSDKEILSFLDILRSEYYGIGQTGEFVISQQSGDSIKYLFFVSNQKDISIKEALSRGLPTFFSLQDTTGSIITKANDGVMVMAAFTNIPSLQWGLVARIPISEVNQPYYLAILVASVISIFLILFCLFLFIKVSNPIVKAVFQSEKLYRKLFENMLNGYSYCKILYTQDEYIDFIYLSVNKAFGTLTGLKDVTGKKGSEVLPEIQKSDKELLEMYKRVATTGEPEEMEVFMKSLNAWLHISVYSPEKEYFIIVFDVITDRKLAEIQLREKNEQIEAKNEEFKKMNEILKQTNQELSIAKEQAEYSDRLKTAFLQNMSHEIRTPMNGILGFAELLKEPGLTSEQQQTYIRFIEKGGDRLLNIINDVVDISKIESGQMKVSISETNLNEQMEYLHEFFTKEAEEKGLKFKLVADSVFKDSNILTDREKLYAILKNLIKNAIKYTNIGSIEFGCTIRQPKPHEVSEIIEFFVSDTGIGILLDRQDAIFERFIQADIVDIQARQGAGLGLAIAKAYVEILGGKIWVKSEVDTGSKFCFTLPFHAIRKEVVGLENEVLSTNTEPKVNKLKILIVEDDDASCSLISIMVHRFGGEVLVANTGIEAVEIFLNNQDINIVLMDIQLPEMDGYEATRKIRQFNNEVVIIAQTAYALSGDREKAIASGCNDYITKPFKANVINELIQKHLKA